MSSVLVIAEVVRRFDVVAVQEVRDSAQAFLATMSVLGLDWAYLVTDVSDGRAGNSERLAFVLDTTRLRPARLACELLLATPRGAGCVDRPVRAHSVRCQLRPRCHPVHPGHAACRVRAGTGGPDRRTHRHRALAGPHMTRTPATGGCNPSWWPR